MAMRVLIIGGVAAGTKVAAKLKREQPEAEILILTKGRDISYAGCGLPYYVGDVIKHREQLIVNTPEAFTALTGAEVQTGVEVTALDREQKQVTAVELETGKPLTYRYDKLVIAVGAQPAVPACEGLDLENIFYLRTPDDAEKLRQKVDAGELKRVVIVGAGLIGLEAAENLAGLHMAGRLEGGYPGVLGTGVAQLPGVNMGRTGLTERAARELGYEVETVVTVTDDKSHYYPGAGSFLTKMICARDTRRLLGVQVLGKGAVDKMVDIAVTAISLGAKLEDLRDCDFAYAPPFSTAIHPFAATVNILLNKLDGVFETVTPAQYLAGEAEGYRMIDCSIQSSIPSVPYLDLTSIEGPVDGLDPEEKLLLVCSKGKRAYLAQNRLKRYGYVNTRVLEGGTLFSRNMIDR